MRRTIHDLEIKNMIRQAKDVMERSYAPYTQYAVGACIKGESGAYYHGCLVENSISSASLCAERSAIYRAISDNEKRFDVLAVISSGPQPAVPCGMCRQVLAEHCDPDMPIICANRSGKYQIFYMGDLLPQPFSAEEMK